MEFILSLYLALDITHSFKLGGNQGTHKSKFEINKIGGSVRGPHFGDGRRVTWGQRADLKTKRKF